MTIASFGPQELSIRPYAVDDRAAVFALVDADPVTVRTEAACSLLDLTLGSHSLSDAGRRVEPTAPRADIVLGPAGHVVGAIGYAIRPSDGSGLIQWLHCREQPKVAEALVAHVLEKLGSRTLLAFDSGSVPGGMAGLSVRCRPVTRKALESAGFTVLNLRRFLHRGLENTPPCGYPLAEVSESPSLSGWRLTLRDTSGEMAGEAAIGRPVDGVGVVWRVSVAPPYRGRGLGRKLLDQCFAELADRGAREVITLVDESAPPGEPDYDVAAADRFCDTSGFVEIDRLCSFTRRP